MKIIIRTLLESLTALANVVAFLFFIILIFAILGTQLFNGLLYNRCRISEAPIQGE